MNEITRTGIALANPMDMETKQGELRTLADLELVLAGGGGDGIPVWGEEPPKP